jgi:hypothetical protein
VKIAPGLLHFPHSQHVACVCRCTSFLRRVSKIRRFAVDVRLRNFGSVHAVVDSRRSMVGWKIQMLTANAACDFYMPTLVESKSSLVHIHCAYVCWSDTAKCDMQVQIGMVSTAEY